MKYVGVLLVALGVAAVIVVPPLAQPAPGPEAGVAEPPLAVCPVEEGSGRTTGISVLSNVDGPTRLTLFASGEPAGSLGTRTGPSGSVVIPVVDVAAVGTVGGLVELPTAASAAGSVVTGAESMSAEACAGVPPVQAFLSGGSTVSGETFVLHLMNPYAGEAVVELVVNSEAGNESNERFQSVVVPPRASAIVDFTELVPGRETLSVAIETVKGRVLAVGRQGVESESATWRAVEPAQDWFLPIPKGPGPKLLVIATPTNSDIAYQVDFFGPEGLEEALVSDTLPPRGQQRIDLAAITQESSGVRVVSAGPVVATLWMEADSGLAVTTASQVEAGRWFLPGASTPQSGWATVVTLNPGTEDAVVALRPLREATTVRDVVVPAGGALEIGIEMADGYLIEATNPVVVMWTAQRGGASLAAIGVPLVDG